MHPLPAAARGTNINHYIGRVPQHHYSFHELLKHQNSDLTNRLKKTPIPVNTVPAKEDEPAAAKTAEANDKCPNAGSNKEASETEGAAAVSDSPTHTLIRAPQLMLNPFQQHTSTLGEQELQNAVEAAAVVFKKVVLQRRKEKAKEKAAEEGEC